MREKISVYRQRIKNRQKNKRWCKVSFEMNRHIEWVKAVPGTHTHSNNADTPSNGSFCTPKSQMKRTNHVPKHLLCVWQTLRLDHRLLFIVVNFQTQNNSSPITKYTILFEDEIFTSLTPREAYCNIHLHYLFRVCSGILTL